MNQGKSDDQYHDSASFAGYAFVALVIFGIIVFFAQNFNEMLH